MSLEKCPFWPFLVQSKPKFGHGVAWGRLKTKNSLPFLEFASFSKGTFQFLASLSCMGGRNWVFSTSMDIFSEAWYNFAVKTQNVCFLSQRDAMSLSLISGQIQFKVCDVVQGFILNNPLHYFCIWMASLRKGPKCPFLLFDNFFHFLSCGRTLWHLLNSCQKFGQFSSCRLRKGHTSKSVPFGQEAIKLPNNGVTLLRLVFLFALWCHFCLAPLPR